MSDRRMYETAGTSSACSAGMFGTEGALLTEYSEEDRAFFAGRSPQSFPIVKDTVESERVGHKISAVPKQCWFNARKAVLYSARPGLA
jgi:hypothetical protein